LTEYSPFKIFCTKYGENLPQKESLLWKDEYFKIFFKKNYSKMKLGSLAPQLALNKKVKK
jgi:hypothetical protein